MERFILPYFSEQQKWVINKRKDNISYAQMCREWPFHEINAEQNSGKNFRKKEDSTLYHNNISICILRSAMGYVWTKGMKGGSDPYLCQADLEQLKMEIFSAANDGSPLDTANIITKAFDLKKARYAIAIDFIQFTNCSSLLGKIQQKQDEERPPVRSWINGVLVELDIAIRKTRIIDILRIICSTPENINRYFDVAVRVIQSINPYLIFGADETMLFPSMKRRVVLPRNIVNEFIQAKVSLPHFTAMCTHNMYGKSLAPFIILPKLQNLPPELKEFAERGEITFASSNSGWETRETFLFLTICFINALSEYRQDLQEEIKNNKALLIIDGHSSRENAYAMQLLSEANVHVLVIPAHTSHILQMFDVALASPLKRVFSDIFNEGLKTLRAGNMAANYRRLAITSFLTAWQSVCNFKNCQAGAKATGTHPCNRNIPISSRFVKELDERYVDKARAHQRYVDNSININSKVLNSDDMMDTLNRYLIANDTDEYCLLKERVPYETSMSNIAGIQQNGSKLLSAFPKYVNEEGIIRKFIL